MTDEDSQIVAVTDENGDPVPLDVLAIHRARGVAVLTNLFVVPVTHWFDWEGDDCEPDEATYCVAGADGIAWFTIDLKSFDHVTVH